MATQTIRVGLELRHRDTCARTAHDPGDLEGCYEQIERWEDIEVPEPSAPPPSLAELLAPLMAETSTALKAAAASLGVGKQAEAAAHIAAAGAGTERLAGVLAAAALTETGRGR